MRQLSNLVAIIVAFGMNIFVNISPPNGLTIGDISNKFFADVLITPANYAFAIWGIIYLGLISFAMYQVLPRQRQNSSLRRLGYLLVVASIAQIVWIFLFLSGWFVFSVVAMVVILLSLMAAYLRLGIGFYPVSRQEKWLIQIPISIYFAWISVATIVNVALALNYLNWMGWGISSVIWTVIMILVATVIAIIIYTKRRDMAYSGVFIWALLAITLRHLDTSIIAIVAGLSVIVLAIMPFLLRGKKL